MTENKDAITAPAQLEHAIDRDPKDAALNAAAKGQTTTGYEELTPWETVKTFKVATAACFLAAFSAATDGYQIRWVFSQHPIFSIVLTHPTIVASMPVSSPTRDSSTSSPPRSMPQASLTTIRPSFRVGALSCQWARSSAW